MPQEVLVVGYPSPGEGPGAEECRPECRRPWDAEDWVRRAVQLLDVLLTTKYGGEVPVRYLDVSAPELHEFPEVQARLSAPDVLLPLVAIDGRVVAEGCFSAGNVLALLADGQRPKAP